MLTIYHGFYIFNKNIYTLGRKKTRRRQNYCDNCRNIFFSLVHALFGFYHAPLSYVSGVRIKLMFFFLFFFYNYYYFDSILLY